MEEEEPTNERRREKKNTQQTNINDFRVRWDIRQIQNELNEMDRSDAKSNFIFFFSVNVE